MGDNHVPCYRPGGGSSRLEQPPPTSENSVLLILIILLHRQPHDMPVDNLRPTLRLELFEVLTRPLKVRRRSDDTLKALSQLGSGDVSLARHLAAQHARGDGGHNRTGIPETLEASG